MPGKRSRRRLDEATAQAQREAAVQYGGQFSALAQMLADSRGEYGQTRKVNASNSRALVAASEQAVPEIRNIYGGDPVHPGEGSILATALAQSQAVGVDPAQLQAFQRRISEEQGRAVAGLEQQRTAALQGRVYANQQARRQYFGEKAKIQGSAQDLAKQAGVFTAARTGQIVEDLRALGIQIRGQNLTAAAAAGSQAQSERGSQYSAGIDPDTGKPIPGGKLDPAAKPKKPVRQTPDKHDSFASQVEAIQGTVGRYKGMSRAQIVQKLTAGRPQQTIKVDPDTGKKLDQPIVLPAIPAYKPTLAMTAALDLALDGHLSRATQEKLHRRKFSIKDLGLGPTYGQWKKRGGKQPRRQTGGAGSGAGGLVGGLLG